MTAPPPPDTPDAHTADLSTDRFDEDIADETDRSRMSFLEHLDELRKRIVYSLYALIAASCVAFWFAERLRLFFLNYFRQALPEGGHLIYTSPMEGFVFYFKIGLFGGLLLASPFMFAQLWFFVAPGLYSKEKKIAIPFVFFSTLLFAAGAAFAHYVAFPSMWTFFGSFANSMLEFMPTIKETFGFYVKMVLGLGLVFQIPMLVFALARFGIVTAKFLWQKIKYAILIIFVISALITPSSDPVNQAIFAAPMLVLYLVSIIVAWIFGKKRKAEDA